MSKTRRVWGMVAAMVMTAASSGAWAEGPEPGWSALVGRTVVVERQDGSRIEGKLLSAGEADLEVRQAGGAGATIARAAIKAVRIRMSGEQVTVTMETDEKISGKLVERDEASIVIEKDDGQRVIVARAPIKTVRTRDPDALVATPALPRGGGYASPSAVEPLWLEHRPPSGSGLFVAGGVFVGVGIANLLTAPLWKLRSNLDQSTQDLGMKVSLGVGGTCAGLGLLLIIGGATQRAKFKEWEAQHGSAAFVPMPGGGALSWRAAF